MATPWCCEFTESTIHRAPCHSGKNRNLFYLFFLFSFKAFNIFSGVMGRWKILTPMAS